MTDLVLPSRADRVRRWLGRLTTGTTTVALLLLAVPAALQLDQPVREPRDARERGETHLAGRPGTGEISPALELVSHRKPHPNRKIKRYRVRPGDTASSIAVRYHAWTKQLIKINHSSTLYVGDVILVPVVVSASRACTKHKSHKTGLPSLKARQAHKAKSHQAAKPHKAKPHKTKSHKAAKPKHHKKKHHAKKHPARAHHHKHRHHHGHGAGRHHHRDHHGWTHENASRAKVRRVIVHVANRWDVNPNLALAIAWQEAGWQQHRLSPAGAVGTMQVMPSTGRWMSLVVGRKLHLRDLHDNVTAGVVLIRTLRSQAKLKWAVAGYYQGLGGVRAYGMYDSTKHYVANVLHIKKRLAHGWNPA
ncbi:MAG: transglycosylase SLT domain-containing protein [Nocardioides sp.]